MGRGTGGSVRCLFRKRSSTTTKDITTNRCKASLNTLPSTASLEDDDNAAADTSSGHWCLSDDGNTRQVEVEEAGPPVVTATSSRRISPAGLPTVPSTASSSPLKDGHEEESAATATDDITMQQQQQHHRREDLDEERLSRWQEMLEKDATDDSLSPMERANLFFATGRLLVHFGRYQEALKYYEQELQMTMVMLKKTTRTTTSISSSNNTTTTLSVDAPGVILVARIHLAIGRVAKNGLHDLTLALQHYEKALKIQTAIYQAAIQQSAKCSKCCTRSPQQHEQVQAAAQKPQRGSNISRRGSRCRGARVGISVTSGSSSPSSPCTTNNNNNNHISCCCTMHHRDKVKEAAAAVEDTRRRIGRIHFEQGNVDLAVRQLSVQRYPCTNNTSNTIRSSSSGQTKQQQQQQQQQASAAVTHKKKITTTRRPCNTSSPTKKDLSNNDHLVEI